MNTQTKIDYLSSEFSSKIYCKGEVKKHLLDLLKIAESEFCADCDYIKERILNELKK